MRLYESLKFDVENQFRHSLCVFESFVYIHEMSIVRNLNLDGYKVMTKLYSRRL